MAKKATAKTAGRRKADRHADKCDQIAQSLYLSISAQPLPESYLGAIPFALMMKFLELKGPELPLKLVRDYREMVGRCLDEEIKYLENLDKKRRGK